jgi:hypothetical protein
MDDELWDIMLDDLTVRELQIESARAITTMPLIIIAYINSIY